MLSLLPVTGAEELNSTEGSASIGRLVPISTRRHSFNLWLGRLVCGFYKPPFKRRTWRGFTFALDTNDIKARLIEKAVRFRNNWLGLPYGDQGLIINKHFYNCLGGYRKWPIMEDVDLVRRIGMSRMVLFDVKARTSAKRYTEEGYIRRIARNFICLSLYFLKLPPIKSIKFTRSPRHEEAGTLDYLC